MIRITVMTQTDEEVMLKVEGWVKGEAVSILEQEVERYLQQAERLLLDLAGVQFIDDAGLKLLQRLARRRLVLREASPFVHALLEAYGLL